ncbi:MAG: aminotransferase class III-fold pyridoxal phosphate-dependent enzyme [Acidobacteria bacterium]|nr:aminotransferase class III-fold pyridoxal phosphate-dependent enzyme [Acidobacteriota bacterium]
MTDGRPSFSTEQAETIAEREFGITGRAKLLASYADQNFLINGSNQKFVLKIANQFEKPEVLDMQNQAMRWVKGKTMYATPSPMAAKSGRDLVLIQSENASYWVRMVSFIPGSFWAEGTPAPEFWPALGQAQADLNLALIGFSHAAQNRELKWNLTQVPKLDFSVIKHPEKQALACFHRDRFNQWVTPHIEELTWAVVHNDANDHNVLMSADGQQPLGLIDFGDMDWAPRLCDLAITAAYGVLDQDEPLRILAQIVAGWHSVLPLTDLEWSCLWPMVCGRLAMSVRHSAESRAAEPENEYLAVTEAPAWRFLEKAKSWHPDFVERYLRAASNCLPSPQAIAFQIACLQHHYKPIMAVDWNRALSFPLDGSRPELLPGSADAQTWSEQVQSILDFAQAPVGIGGYAEKRTLYQSPLFHLSGKAREIHLGIDLFAPEHTPVYAPLPGKIHSLKINNNSQDYGGTLLVKFTWNGPALYALYGHLSHASLDHWQVGDTFEAGDTLGFLGNEKENGGWAPHLHFQLMFSDCGYEGDFPGVATQDEAAAWLDLCPDPRRLMNLPECLTASAFADKSKLRERRQSRLAANLSLSYSEPLYMVRGYGQYLYDEHGRAYLDCVNNVAHVGHCQKQVVLAGQKQMHTLNTNTRYLHHHILDLSDALCATLPGLDVCFLVNSGSEANDLAMRLARAFTGQQHFYCFEAAYHGHLSPLIDVSPYKCLGPGGLGLGPAVTMLPLPDTVRGAKAFSDPGAGAFYAQPALDILASAAKRGIRPAALIAESIPGCGGQLVLPQGYLAALYQAIHEQGGLVIADEVQTGLGRVGTHFWAFQQHGVIPDIVTIGKPLGNGHPVAAVVTRREIADAFANGMEYFNTFGGNPVSCAIALEVLKVIENESLQANALMVGEYLKEQFEALKNDLPQLADVRGTGLFLGLEWVHPDTLHPNPELASQVVEGMRHHQILLSTDGPHHNVTKIKPPMVFNLSNAESLVKLLRELLGIRKV